MVKRLLEVAGGITWQTITVALTLIAAIATFAIRLGSTETHVIINGDRLSIIETEHKDLERTLSRLLASQSEQDRRLNTIKTHDIDTRNIESKILGRLSKIEVGH